MDLLEELRDKRRMKVLIFTATKRMADELTRELRHKRHMAASIHGDKSQRERENTLKEFRHMKEGVLVATDVAARGLDIRDLPCVINFDFPGTMEDYVHRIGRTGRAGDKGDAHTLLTAVCLCFFLNTPTWDKTFASVGSVPKNRGIFGVTLRPFFGL